MKRALSILLIAAAATGCKKDDTAGEGGGTAKGTAAGTAKAGGTTSTGVKRPSQQPMQALPALELPEDAKRADKVALGHALFFEPRLSVDGKFSCYSCHQNEHGNGGKDPIAIGPKGKLARHSPVIWNVGYFKGKAFYWDGRSDSLEAQAKAAWAGGNMGVGEENLAAKATEIGKIEGYKTMFEAAFPGQAVTPELVTQALAEYERTLICKDTAYDKFAAGDKAALSEEQQRGLDVFLGKGGCATCHAPPFFSTAMGTDGGVYFNVGIGTQGVAEDKVDIGRKKVTESDGDWAAFKPPSLRNVARSAPYFHDGSVATLEEAVKIMASGGIDNKNKTPILTDKGLTDAELKDLVTFLGGLDCPGKLEPPAKMP